MNEKLRKKRFPFPTRDGLFDPPPHIKDIFKIKKDAIYDEIIHLIKKNPPNKKGVISLPITDLLYFYKHIEDRMIGVRK